MGLNLFSNFQLWEESHVKQRRPKGEGSITQLPNGKLKMTISIGVDITGKQRRGIMRRTAYNNWLTIGSTPSLRCLIVFTRKMW